VENQIAGSNFWHFYTHKFHVTASIFPPNKLGPLFGLVGWTQSEQYHWYWRKWWAFSSSVISTCELTWIVGMSVVSIANSVICFRYHVENTVFHLQT